MGKCTHPADGPQRSAAVSSAKLLLPCHLLPPPPPPFLLLLPLPPPPLLPLHGGVSHPAASTIPRITLAEAPPVVLVCIPVAIFRVPIHC